MPKKKSPAKINNFQIGSSGFTAGDKTFTFKSREFIPGNASSGRKRGKTLAYNVRCDKDRSSDACKAAVAIMQKVQNDMASIPTDSNVVRTIKRAKKRTKRG